jgi:hypothetical protein
LLADGPNPAEFAIDVALNSLTTEIHYTSQATLEELRSIVFAPADLGLSLVGQTANVRGRLFIDGVLAVFAVKDVSDLTGVTLTLRVTIMKEVANADPQTVFLGSMSIAGGADRQVTATAEGDLPTGGIVDTDLANVDPQLGTLRVFVLPNLVLDYVYPAVAGQPFDLRATVEIEAVNQPGGIGVAAILGAPLETLQEVIAATRDAATAEAMTTALQDERAAPTGEPTFPTRPAPPLACGLFGFEGWLGVLGLVVLRRGRGRGVLR